MLAAASFAPGREADQSRYQYVGGVLLLLVLGNAVAGVRLGATEILATLGVACVATIANLAVLHHEYGFLRDRTIDERGALAGLEVAGSRADPFLTSIPATRRRGLFSLTVGPYLSAVDAFGSPADDLLELSHAPETARIAADRLNAQAEHLIPDSGWLAADGDRQPAAARRCGRRATRPEGKLPDAQYTQRARGRHPAATGSHAPGRARLTRGPRAAPVREHLRTLLRAPVAFCCADPGDRSPQRWQALLRGPGPVTICGLASGPGLG